MQSYNIILRSKPAGKVFLHTLTYRDGIVVHSGLAITANTFASLIKYITTEDKISITSDLSATLKKSFIKPSSSLAIDFDAAPVLISYTGAESAMSIDAFADFIRTCKLGDIDNSIGLQVTPPDILKINYEEFANQMSIVSSVADTAKHDYEKFTNDIGFASSIDGLFYRGAGIEGQSSIVIDASLTPTLTRYRLLSELDDLTLAEMDDLTLDELDRVVLT